MLSLSEIGAIRYNKHHAEQKPVMRKRKEVERWQHHIQSLNL